MLFRSGATASSANEGVMVNIMREEWDFNGYNVTDFTGVSLRAAPKESILCGTTAFCGFGSPNLEYWNNDLTASANILKGDKAICAAIKDNIHHILYSLANSAAVNGTNNTTHRVQLASTWRKIYWSLEGIFGATTGLLAVGWVALEVLDVIRKKEEV